MMVLRKTVYTPPNPLQYRLCRGGLTLKAYTVLRTALQRAGYVFQTCRDDPAPHGQLPAALFRAVGLARALMTVHRGISFELSERRDQFPMPTGCTRPFKPFSK